MKRNGFTLIELLAVIVILAIIALIATPIILGIINDAREETNQRNFELYVSAVKNAIASYQLEESDAPTDFNKLDMKTEDGSVECSTKKLHSDGSFYLANCLVNGAEVDYTYGLPYIPYRPQYNFCTEGFSLKKIGTEAFENHSVSTERCGYSYIGYDVDSDNIITAAYACFVRNEIEYCLKGYDKDAYATNVDIIKQAYADVLDDACDLEADGVACDADHLFVEAHSNLSVGAIFLEPIYNFSYKSYIYNDGRFEYDVGDRS